MSNIYQEKGYRDRDHYLECLAEDTGTDLDSVYALADLFGPSEDFDGLVSALPD